MQQLHVLIKNTTAYDFPKEVTKLRLGHLVEHFVIHQLQNDTDIEILATNTQIQQGKITIGELDCLLKIKGTPIHLEIVYKFYLYDETVGHTELEHWIGPNRKDSLIEKITKLKNKQLPLLYKPETAALLTSLKLDVNHIHQLVCFKAQLFVPYALLHKPLRLINNDCIQGYYLHFNALETLNEYLFYIPSKRDWLVQISQDVDWIPFNESKAIIEASIAQQKAPLCWVKGPYGQLEKIFVVWWS